MIRIKTMNNSLPDDDWHEFESVLDAVEQENVFTIDKVGPDDVDSRYLIEGETMFLIAEQCDNFFKVIITRDQLRQLGEDIIALANKVEP